MSQVELTMFRIEKRADGVAVIWMDMPGDAVNTLKAECTDEFAEVFERVGNDDEVKAVVFASAKKDNFIAGANLDMLQAAKTAADAEALSRAGQLAMDRIESFSKPVVAAVHGPALGGGLEVALACHERVASDSDKTRLGLPEAQLGVLPGSGGTQRLPQLVGVQAALDMLLTGRNIRSRKAKKMGLVDEVVAPPVLVEAAAKRALARVGKSGRKGESSLWASFSDREALTEAALAGNPVGRKLVFDQARKQTRAKTRGNYPAQESILDVVQTGLAKGRKAGYDAEAKAFGELVVSPEAAALRSIFFGTQALKKDSGVDDKRVKPRSVERIGVLGAGLMGAGIAYVTTSKLGIPVRLKDRDDDGVRRGLKSIHRLIDKDASRRRITKHQALERMNRVTGTTDFSGFGTADVVIEAVFEDLGLKHEMLRAVEAATGPNTIYASNTSSIPIGELAKAAERPENVLGMHYFSPVPKMPLLEIIVTDKTAPWVTATAVELGKRQGKHVIVVGDGPGFYTTRILGPMLNEAVYVLSEGVPIERIDEAMLDFGFPVGPVKLIDEVGIDVGAKVSKILLEAFGSRMAPPDGMAKLVADGRLGRKSNRGFYLYDGTAKGVDTSVYELLGVELSQPQAPKKTIAARCALVMVNEAVRALEEGVLRSPRDGDIGAIFGLGFPPFRGGPFRYVDAVGAEAVVGQLRELEARHGERFTPAPLLVEMAKTNRLFHQD